MSNVWLFGAWLFHLAETFCRQAAGHPWPAPYGTYRCYRGKFTDLCERLRAAWADVPR